MRSKFISLALAGLLFGGCADSENPADGGFISGLKGVTTGEYQRRVDERRRRVDALSEEQAAVNAETANSAAEIEKNDAEIERLQADLDRLKRRIELSIARIKRINRALSMEERATVEAAHKARREQPPDQERLDALRKSVSAARELAEQLAAIDGG